MSNITAIYYPEARHELLNETNRDEVQQDALDWIEEVPAG
jgi:alpha-beta hydrolase superfamily lysophospholipase